MKDFENKINAMQLTNLQKLEIKLAGTILAGEPWKEGYERSQEITAQTLSILQ